MSPSNSRLEIIELEIVLAYIRLLDDSVKQVEFLPVASEEETINLVNSILTEEQKLMIKDVWGKVGTVNIMKKFIGVEEINVSIEDQRELTLMHNNIIKNVERNISTNLLSDIYNNLSLTKTPIEEVLESSLYWDTNYDALLECREMTVNIIESIFLPPAPLGKYGFYLSDKKKLILIKGYHNHFIHSDNEYLYDLAENNSEWMTQWYRMGIWHSTARNYWDEKLYKFELEGFLNLPENFRLKFFKSGHVLKPYQRVKDYFLDHLTHATKVVAEQKMFGDSNENAEINRRALYSWGMFYIDWFIEKLENYTEDNSNFIKELTSEWVNIVKDYDKINLPFIGSIGSCATPIWKNNIHLVFSPSISKMIRRKVKIWFIQNWNINPKIHGGDLNIDDMFNEENCYLVFALNKDERWLRPQLDHLKGSGIIKSDDFEAEKLKGVFLIKNDTSSKWTKVTVSGDEGELLDIHRNANFNYDYSFKIDSHTYRGLYE
jgi:hypothetical protein